jgi:hypothetical protein
MVTRRNDYQLLQAGQARCRLNEVGRCRTGSARQSARPTDSGRCRRSSVNGTEQQACHAVVSISAEGQLMGAAPEKEHNREK